MITIYTFEDADGRPVEHAGQMTNPMEADGYGRIHRLKVIANEYEFNDSELIADYTQPTPIGNPGTHRSHCCKRHGCKYGSPGCPVLSGELVQDHPCEVCEFDTEDDEEGPHI